MPLFFGAKSLVKVILQRHIKHNHPYFVSTKSKFWDITCDWSITAQKQKKQLFSPTKIPYLQLQQMYVCNLYPMIQYMAHDFSKLFITFSFVHICSHKMGNTNFVLMKEVIYQFGCAQQNRQQILLTHNFRPGAFGLVGTSNKLR